MCDNVESLLSQSLSRSFPCKRSWALDRQSASKILCLDHLASTATALPLKALEEARVLVAESVAACEGRVGQLECNGKARPGFASLSGFVGELRKAHKFLVLNGLNASFQ